MGLCIVPGIYAGGVGLCAQCRFFCVLFAARRPVHRAAGRPEEGGFVEKSCPRWLCWPRNVVIYVILALVLRIFAIPFILYLPHQKRYADGLLEAGGCRRSPELVQAGWGGAAPL